MDLTRDSVEYTTPDPSVRTFEPTRDVRCDRRRGRRAVDEQRRARAPSPSPG